MGSGTSTSREDALAFPGQLFGMGFSAAYLSTNSVDKATSSPHAGHFFVSTVEYTTPQTVHALRDCLLTAILVADIEWIRPRRD
jgi:hypothetical protein